MKRMIFAALAASMALTANAQKVEPLPYGDFSQWTKRIIKESGIIGGKSVTLYVVAKNQTIDNGNKPYDFLHNGSIWGSSNSYATVGGINKASVSLVPEKRGDGYCAKMSVLAEKVKAMGIVNINVVATGTLFTGSNIDPMTNADDPLSGINFGIPFTRRPNAVVFDYKCEISPENTVTEMKVGKSPKTLQGHDRAQVFLMLQKRWETPDGKLHALRVGTAQEYFPETVSEWKNGHRVKVIYGKSNLKALDKSMRSFNSKGELVEVVEEGYAPEGTEPTHMILSFGAGSMPVYTGHIGNVLWIDNIGLEY